MKRLWALLLAVFLIVPAAAHQQKAAISTVEHNPRTGLLEVVHFVPLHDAEHALRQQGSGSADIVDNIESRRAFTRYVASRFAIAVAGEPIALTVLGSEIDGGNLVIYSEGASPGAGSEITVQSLILTDIWSTQVNRVNVGRGTSPTTLVFRAGARPQSAVLD